MDIAEMHVSFRQYAQQMGMQNVRAITPEQIDVVLNTSISDILNQLIRENINQANPNTNSDTPKLGQLDSFGTLYVKADITLHQDFVYTPIRIELNTYITNCFYFIGLSVNYCNEDDKKTPYFPVKLVDDIYLSETLTDFILGPKYKSPVASIYNNADNKKFLDIYVAKEVQKVNEYLETIKCSYIKVPAKVSYSGNVSCDLPDRLHESVIKHAVDLYRNSVAGGAFVNTQSQAQPQTGDNI